MRRLISAALLLYPRAVRRHHGAELESLVEELIERDGASRPVLVGRLLADGLVQRLTSRSTAWVVAVTLVITSVGGLAVSDFATASAHRREPVQAAPATLTHTAVTNARRARAHHRRRRAATAVNG